MKTSLKIDRSSQPDVFSNLFFQYLIFFLTLSSTIGCYTELKYEENKFKRCSVREGHNHILNVSEAIEILRNTRHFGGTHRGRSCRLLDTVIAYKVVLQSKQADAYFKSILKDSDLPGQLYALTGIYSTDNGSLCELLTPFLGNKQQVLLHRGCTLRKKSVSLVAEEIWEGIWSYKLGNAKGCGS